MPITMTALAHCMKRKKKRTGRRVVEVPLPNLNAIVFDVCFYSVGREDLCAK